MPAIADFCVGDIGAKVDVQVFEDGGALNVSGASTTQYVLVKPVSGDSVTVTAALRTDGADGWLRWTTTSSSDLDEAGVWRGQVKITGLSSWSGRSVTTFSFLVRDLVETD